MNKVINDQLQKIQCADLSNYDVETNTYFIPKKKEIKIEEDYCYLIKIKPSAAHNSAVNVNWNQGSCAPFDCMKVDVSKKMGKMIKITGLRYNLDTKSDEAQFWSGWIHVDDIEIIQKL